MTPKFPVYIVSKGRWDSRLTVRTLDDMRVPYHIIVERQEYEQYAAVIDPARILILDPAYQARYDTFDDLGDTKSKGPGPARNFAWDHAIAAGAPYHWVMDDNIRNFGRMHKNMKIPFADGTSLRCMEDFVLRYINVAMAGPQYHTFVMSKYPRPPLNFNTRIYSCNLIRNDVPFRWRGRYNEDTDLSLRMLKAGWCTVEFNAFMQYKCRTQSINGGNMADFYSKEGTEPKSEMLARMHPDVVKLVHKYHRAHHLVDYSRFKRNKLIRRKDIVIPTGVNNYGMELRTVAMPAKLRKHAHAAAGKA